MHGVTLPAKAAAATAAVTVYCIGVPASTQRHAPCSGREGGGKGGGVGLMLPFLAYPFSA